MPRSDHSPIPGQRVQTLSGKHVGTVREVSPAGYRVTTDDGHSAWLSNSSIYLSETERLTLVCEEQGLPSYRLAG